MAGTIRNTGPRTHALPVFRGGFLLVAGVRDQPTEETVPEVTNRRSPARSGEVDQQEGSVVVFDGLEKLQGTFTSQADVQASAEAVFVKGREYLRSLPVHTIFTIPTYLLSRAGNRKRDNVTGMHGPSGD